jgi:hypothetical protein
MPAGAIEAWQGPDRDVAADSDVRRWLLSYAILAPQVEPAPRRRLQDFIRA